MHSSINALIHQCIHLQAQLADRGEIWEDQKAHMDQMKAELRVGGLGHAQLREQVSPAASHRQCRLTSHPLCSLISCICSPFLLLTWIASHTLLHCPFTLGSKIGLTVALTKLQACCCCCSTSIALHEYDPPLWLHQCFVGFIQF